ncbi:unnamed protein product [Diamesa serratosioi]
MLGNKSAPIKALNLDSEAQRKFITFYNSKFSKDSTSTVVRFFERTDDYYSLHGKDAEIVATKSIIKSSISIKLMDPRDELETLKFTSINKNDFEKVVRDLLLVKNYRVEVFTKDKAGWKLGYHGSPGNLLQFEELLYSSNDQQIVSNLLLSIQIITVDQKKKLGVASIDSCEHSICVVEMEDSDFYTELEALTVILSVKECILPSLTGEYERMKEVLERNGILVTAHKKADFSNSSEFAQDLQKLIRFKKGQQKNIHVLPEMKLELAMGSLAASLKYLELVKEESNLGQFQIKLLNLNRFVHLDAAAVSALNLFPPPDITNRSSAYKWQSIMGVLDRCKTSQGRRLLSQWIKQPLRSLEIIKDRHDIVESLYNDQSIRDSFHKQYLNSIPDILMLNNKLTRKRATLQDVFKIYRVVLRIPEIIDLLQKLDNSAVNIVVLQPLKDIYGDLKNYKDMVEEVLDMEEAAKGEYRIRSSFDEKLADIALTMSNIYSKMKIETTKSAKILDLEIGGSGIKLDYVSHIGHFFRSTLKVDTTLRKHSDKFKTIDTARGGIRFTTDTLKSLNEKHIEQKEIYEEQQTDIVKEIVRVAAGYSGPMYNLNVAIAQLDCLVSLAEVAANSPGVFVRPKMYSEDDRKLDLKELRHPCLELQDGMDFIPNSVHMKDGETNMYIITGANISGKSTFIRSIGVSVLLAHIGSFVPCEEAHISMFDAILGRIGANDCIAKGLSTFMVEMVETSSILQTATKNSLVIIDELGRGTSTYEGCGIAYSVAEHLAEKIKCFTLFATHFHEITSLADNSPVVKNYHLAAITTDGKLTLLFQVKPGPIDKSFGIQVAEIAQLPQTVLVDAKKFLEDIEIEQFQDQADEKTKQIYKFLDTIRDGVEVSEQMIKTLKKELNVC